MLSINLTERFESLRPLGMTVLLVVGFCIVCLKRASGDQPVVLAHYMPWFSANEEDGSWGYHWTMNHFDPSNVIDGRRSIASAYYPLAGTYDSGDPSVLEYHVLLMRVAGIDGVIVDWYGLTDLYDYPINHRNTFALISQLDRYGLKFAICYEDQTLNGLVKNQRIKPDEKTKHVANEIRWMQENWFGKSNYVRLDGSPVLLSFGNNGLSDQEWADALSIADVELNYLSEHTRRECAVGAFDWPVPDQGLRQIERFNERRTSWEHAIPCAYPRFDDFYQESQVNDGYPVIADDGGKTLSSTLANAMRLGTPLLQLVTWNDWGEGTQIEPSRELGYRDLQIIQSIVLGATALDAKQRKERQSAFELPLRLLKLRRSHLHAPDRLDSIGRNLATGDYELATRQMKFLENQVVETQAGAPGK